MAARSRPDRDDARVARVPLDRLRVHPRNVRHDLGDLRELAASIAADGILVPLMAERRGDSLRILHGHRRAAAADQAGLRTVPCVVVPEHTDEQAIVLMLAENTRRQGLTPAEKRDAVDVLHNQHGYSVVEIAERLGVSAGTIYAWRREAVPVDEVPAATASEPQARPAVVAPGTSSPPARPKGQHRRVVSVSKVRDLTERWQGHAPPMLLRELRQLLGEQPAPASIADRRQAGGGA